MDNYNNTRIDLHDSTMDIIIKMAEGNPGAMTVLMLLIQNADKVDPQDAMAPFGTILSLDAHGIYADRIWMLYKDVCGEDIGEMIGVMRAMQLGFVSDSEVDHAIDHHGDGLDVDDLINQVCGRLPDFDASAWKASITNEKGGE